MVDGRLARVGGSGPNRPEPPDDGLPRSLRALAQPIARLRHDFPGMAANRQTVVSGGVRHARRGDFRKTPPITRPCGCALRIGRRHKGSSHPDRRARSRSAPSPRPGRVRRRGRQRPTAKSVLRPPLTLHRIVSYDLAQFVAGAAATRPVAARQIAAFLMQLGCVDPSQANSLTAELDAVAIRNAHGSGIGAGAK